MIDHVIQKVKFTKMEYSSVSGEKKTIPISRVFLNAIITRDLSPKPGDDRLCGLNLGIVIPFADAQEGSSWYDDFCGKDWGLFGVVVSSEEGFRLPIVVHAGNYYDAAYGSACLFGCFSPGYFEDRLRKAVGVTSEVERMIRGKVEESMWIDEGKKKERFDGILIVLDQYRASGPIREELISAVNDAHASGKAVYYLFSMIEEMKPPGNDLEWLEDRDCIRPLNALSVDDVAKILLRELKPRFNDVKLFADGKLTSIV